MQLHDRFRPTAAQNTSLHPSSIATRPPQGFGAVVPADLLASRTDEAGATAPNSAAIDAIRYKIASGQRISDEG